MITYLADIIPKIQRFSQKLDDLTRLTNQHWVSLDHINNTKRVFIFRTNNQLIISENGIVEKGTWEYLGNQTLLLETKQESYLLKHGFFDENVIALKLDSTESYAFFVNETKYQQELNNISDILKFLEKKYLKTVPNLGGQDSTEGKTKKMPFGYEITNEAEKYDIIWGSHTAYELHFSNGNKGTVYKGNSTGKYFYMETISGKKYFLTFKEAALGLHLYLEKMNMP